MGDIAFTIEKFVDLNKVVNLEILKTVDVNVNNPDQLATAEADAEAIGPFALAEVDAYTFVNEGDRVFIPHPGLIDALGNTTNFILGPDADGDGAADTVTVSFTSDGQPGSIPDVDDINGFGNLEPLSSPPPDTADVPLPDPLISITDLNLQQITAAEIISTPEGDILSAQYELVDNWVVTFDGLEGDRALDLDSDGLTGEGPLTLTVEAGADFLVEYLDPTNAPNGPIELEFAAGDAFFTYDDTFELGPTNFPVTALVIDAESLQDPTFSIGDWGFEAASDFGRFDMGDGEAFAYAESSAALDLL